MARGGSESTAAIDIGRRRSSGAFGIEHRGHGEMQLGGCAWLLGEPGARGRCSGASFASYGRDGDAKQRRRARLRWQHTLRLEFAAERRGFGCADAHRRGTRMAVGGLSSCRDGESRRWSSGVPRKKTKRRSGVVASSRLDPAA